MVEIEIDGKKVEVQEGSMVMDAANKLGVYQYKHDGSLRFIRAVPNNGAAICWLRTNRSGTRLYTSNTGTNSITVYDLSDLETPRQIQDFVLSRLGNVLQI